MIFCAGSRDHLHEIMEIERVSFPSPWDEETFAATLEDERCISAVAVDGGMLKGYCLALKLNSMLHILNLAVRPDCRRTGIGRMLIDRIIRPAASEKAFAVLEVRRSNTAARRLYGSMGFSDRSVWHGYYTDTNEDAIIMTKDLRLNAAQDMPCTIVRNDEIAARTFHMVLEGRLPESSPGQFVMVQVNASGDPFLRRPLAILGQDGTTIEILYKVKGFGTEILSNKMAGESVRMLGPLGRGFIRHEGMDIVYVAGGTGLPPIIALAERMKAGRLILGARTRADLPLIGRIRAIPGMETIIVTEDGSLGEKGMATDALRTILPAGGGDGLVIYACGPDGMLREVTAMARTAGCRCEVSLEERMSCGFGACAGCVVKTTSGNLRVCREGPVFNGFDIVWS